MYMYVQYVASSADVVNIHVLTLMQVQAFAANMLTCILYIYIYNIIIII